MEGAELNWTEGHEESLGSEQRRLSNLTQLPILCEVGRTEECQIVRQTEANNGRYKTMDNVVAFMIYELWSGVSNLSFW